MIRADRPVSKESDSLGLRFDSHDDALDYARAVVENANRLLAVKELNVANRYIEGELEIHLVSYWDRTEYHLVFRSIPNRPIKAKGWPATNLGNADGYISRDCPDGSDDVVFICATELVECPEKVIPSFVWLERPHKVADFIRQVLTPPLECTLELGGVGSEREVRWLNGSKTRDGVQGLVERGAEVGGSVRSNTRQIDGQLLEKFQRVQLARAIVITLNDNAVGVRIEENITLPLKVTDVILCKSDVVL